MEDEHLNPIPIRKIEPDDDFFVASSTSQCIKRKTRSRVWDEYKPVFEDGKINGAYCNHCHMRLSAKPNSGTSHLGRHLEKCPVRKAACVTPPPYQKQSPPSCGTEMPPVYQPQYSFSEDCSFEQKVPQFDQQKSSEDLAKLLVSQKLPFSLVEHDAFRAFAMSLNPMFQMVSHSSLEDACIALFGKEKLSLKEKIALSCERMSLSGTIWTHTELGQYLVFTAHFIDQDWKIQKRIIKFGFVNFTSWGALGKHYDSKRALTNGVWKAIRDWNLDEKILSITWGDTDTCDEVVNRLTEKIGKNKLLLKGKLFNAPCLHNVLNLVEDYWREIDILIDSIKRGYLRIHMCSSMHKQKYKEITCKLGLNFSHNGLGHWYSTYNMLEIFLYVRTSPPSFLTAEDIYYINHISCEEVKVAESVCKLLKAFYRASMVFSDQGTSNGYFHEMWRVRKTLQEVASHDHEAVARIAKNMQFTFEKYWRDSYLWLSIPVVLDPRFKIQYIEFRFRHLFGSDASKYISEVRNTINGLCFELCSDDDKQSGYLLSCEFQDTNGISDSCDLLDDWDQFLCEKTSSQYGHANRTGLTELGKFFEEPLLSREGDFDILSWWKINAMQYPVLARIARQFLAVPMSSISPTKAFSGIDQLISQSRNTLSSDTIEALLCMQDWNALSADASDDLDDFKFPA